MTAGFERRQSRVIRELGNEHRPLLGSLLVEHG
jgi:hypothetical protein